jgi:hypothetical protein
MYGTRFLSIALLGGATLLFAVDLAQAQRGRNRSQRPGGDGGGPGGAFPGGGFWRPGGGDSGGDASERIRRFAEMVFDRYSGGKDVIVISEFQSSRDPSAQERLREFAERAGIRNGQVTREQFTKYLEERMAQRMSGDQGRGGDQDRGGDDRGNGDQGREEDFSFDPRWNEPEPQQEEKRPVVYTAQNLPEELTGNHWFASLDRDQDGQVALYEWKAAGRSLAEFRTVDVNADGFATAEEALWQLKAQGGSEEGQGTSLAGEDPYGDYRRDPGRDLAERFFSALSGGKDVIVIGEAESPYVPDLRAKLEAFAEQEGITNGQLSREQFSRYLESRFRGMGGDPSRGPPWEPGPGFPGTPEGSQ